MIRRACIREKKCSRAFCRFDHAVSAIDKARIKDPGNTQVVTMHNRVKAVARARSLGNELYNSGKFQEACLAYGEGLKQNPTNKVLYCNRAACWFKLGQWEKSIEDCNEALKIHPNYTKASLRRAASYDKVAYIKFDLHPSIITKVWFSTLNYKTEYKRPSNSRNWANLALWVVLKVISHFVKIYRKLI